MKMLAMLAAVGLVAGAGVAPVAASAQGRTVVHERVVVRHDNHRRWRPHVRQVCRTYWNHGHKVRRCRTVRR
jgi:hypothetical protein